MKIAKCYSYVGSVEIFGYLKAVAKKHDVHLFVPLVVLGAMDL